MHAWFLLGASTALYIAAFLSFITLLFIGSQRVEFKLFGVLAVFFYACFSLGVADFENKLNLIGTCVRIILVGYVILLKNQYKIILFNYFVKIFVVVGIVGFPLYAIDVALNVFPSIDLTVDNIQATYNNHIFFLSPTRRDEFYRYMSVYLEPGYLGMISALLLYALQFDFKLARTKLLLLLSIMSFSTASFALVLLGYLFHLISVRGMRFYQFFGRTGLFLIASVCLYLGTILVADGAVWSKLQLVFDGGFMEHRLSSDFKRAYNSSGMETLLYGIGNQQYMELFPNGGSAGWKVFILIHGLINLFLLLLVYLSLVRRNYCGSVLFFFLLYTASFTQRAYAMWEVQLLIFICGTAYIFEMQRLSGSRVTQE